MRYGLATWLRMVALVTASLGCEYYGELETEAGTGYEELVHENGIIVNGIEINGLQLNAIRLNAIRLNAIRLNAIRLNGLTLDDLPLTEAQWEAFLPVWIKLVGCALPAGATVTLEDEGITARGALGLAPEWETGPVSAVGGRRVSACLAALANYHGVPVEVSLRSPHIASTKTERRDFSVREGAFWGDLFTAEGTEPWLSTCPATRNPEESQDVNLNRRQCTHPVLDGTQPCYTGCARDPNYSMCGPQFGPFGRYSLCDSACAGSYDSTSGHYGACGFGATSGEAITVWLRAI